MSLPLPVVNIHRTTLVTMPASGWSLVRITNLITKKSKYVWVEPESALIPHSVLKTIT